LVDTVPYVHISASELFTVEIEGVPEKSLHVSGAEKSSSVSGMGEEGRRLPRVDLTNAKA